MITASGHTTSSVILAGDYVDRPDSALRQSKDDAITSSHMLRSKGHPEPTIGNQMLSARRMRSIVSLLADFDRVFSHFGGRLMQCGSDRGQAGCDIHAQAPALFTRTAQGGRSPGDWPWSR